MAYQMLGKNLWEEFSTTSLQSMRSQLHFRTGMIVDLATMNAIFNRLIAFRRFALSVCWLC